MRTPAATTPCRGSSRSHPDTLETVRRSPDLPGGPTWPGGHRRARQRVAVRRVRQPRAPARRPILDGARLGRRCRGTVRTTASWCCPTATWSRRTSAAPGPADPDGRRPAPSELLVLEPEHARHRRRAARCPSRRSPDSAPTATTCTSSATPACSGARWDGAALDARRRRSAPRYRTLDGQTYGWDAVIDGGAAWFLDNGERQRAVRRHVPRRGRSTRRRCTWCASDLADGAVTLTEICGLPGGLVANPPAVDAERRIAVGYDSGNGVVAAFRLRRRRRAPRRCGAREQNHACAPAAVPRHRRAGADDHDAARSADQVVVLDIETGEELGRVDTGSPVQSVVFPARRLRPRPLPLLVHHAHPGRLS